MFDRFIRCSFLVFALSASTACSSTPATTSTGDASAGSTPNGATPISSAGTKDGATIVAGARSERSEAPILDSSAVIVVSGLACPKCASNVDVQ
ncbi:MAG: hypothetical protein FJ253_11990, partial [Phycisphaerae bacterium]|nr:hypothetical protein [Phycisphaerae bacterium]